MWWFSEDAFQVTVREEDGARASMAAEAILLAEMGEVAGDDGMTPGETDRLLILEAIDVAVPRADPAGAEHLEPNPVRQHRVTLAPIAAR
jgi:hypothetical protein